MKSVLLRCLGATVLLLLVASLALSQNSSAQADLSVKGMQLSKLVNGDGTLNLPFGFSGSIDPTGWSVTLGSDGKPHFIPATAPGSSAGIAADTADVHWDNRFIGPSGVDGLVTSMAVMGSDIYFAGLFQGSEKVLANNIVKWNTVSGAWSALGVGVDAQVNALAVIDTNLYVAGAFTHAGGAAVRRIAKWNNAGWSTLGASPNDGVSGTVYALAASGTNLFAGGAFTTAGSGTTVNRVARWDGSAWSALGTGVGSTVYALCVSGSDLYAGGAFTTAGGNPAHYIARWTGSTWATLGTTPNDGVNNTVNAITAGTPYLYVGGTFTSAGSGTAANYIARWNGSSWSALGNGFTTGEVECILVDGPSVYAGGSFTASGIMVANRIARWDTALSTWAALNEGADDDVNCMMRSGATLYVGGAFTSASNTTTPSPANHIARWSGSSWSDLGSSASNSVNGSVVNNVTISGSDVYIGGEFNTAAGIIANNVVRYSSASNTWASLGTGTNNGVDGMVNVVTVAPNGNVYVGGEFTHAGTIAANHIAMWNGSTWSTLGTSPNDGVDGPVLAILINGSNVFVGGDFGNAGGATPAANIARWSGSAWSNLSSGMSSQVNALEVIGSDLYAGGAFVTAGGTTVNFVAKWNGANWLPLGTPPNVGVHGLGLTSLAKIGSTLYVGGLIDSAGGATVAANGIAQWNGSTWAPLGNGVAGWAVDLAPSGGSLYVTGLFSATGILTANGVARWDTAAGGSWTPLGSGFGNISFGNLGLTVAASGIDVWFGGYFVQAGGKASYRVAHWNPTLVTSGVSGRSGLPGEFALAQNFPNPFNPATTIRYSLARQVNVRLEVFNILGEKVTTLVNGMADPGTHNVTFDASRFASGIYFYRLTAGNFVETRKLVLLK